LSRFYTIVFQIDKEESSEIPQEIMSKQLRIFARKVEAGKINKIYFKA